MQAFEASVARWYDDHMARVSGWYKRHVRWISLSVGLVLVILFNLDAIRIADSLYSDQAVRGSVVTQATQAASCGDKPPATCLADLQAKIGLFRLGGLPVGWAGVPVCAQRSCSWLDRRGLTNPGKSGIDSVGGRPARPDRLGADGRGADTRGPLLVRSALAARHASLDRPQAVGVGPAGLAGRSRELRLRGGRRTRGTPSR
jgi:hypothetical protein